jgi:hypothetical protein
VIAWVGSMSAKPLAEGWYRDPYGVHEDRWMSQGVPTMLVRDNGRESDDPPPDRPLPDADLVPADQGAGDQANGSDLRRADDVDGRPYDPAEARSAAIMAASLPGIWRFFSRRSTWTR